jgi:hypothetical protein
MKYLLLLLFLSGCSSAPKSAEVYECAIYTLHGIQAKLKGNFENLEEALSAAKIVQGKFIIQGTISASTDVMCFKQKDLESVMEKINEL